MKRFLIYIDILGYEERAKAYAKNTDYYTLGRFMSPILLPLYPLSGQTGMSVLPAASFWPFFFISLTGMFDTPIFLD